MNRKNSGNSSYQKVSILSRGIARALADVSAVRAPLGSAMDLPMPHNLCETRAGTNLRGNTILTQSTASRWERLWKCHSDSEHTLSKSVPSKQQLPPLRKNQQTRLGVKSQRETWPGHRTVSLQVRPL